MSSSGRNLKSRASKRRRERLSDLEREIDPAVWDERRLAIRALLRKPLLTEATSPERILVARHREWIGLWFAHHPGWEFQYSPEACRLVKRPANTSDDSRPCRDPKSKDTPLTRRGYVFLCVVLSILQRESRQFTLKGLADSLAGIGESEATFAGNGVPLALDQRAARRDLVLALRVLMDWNVISEVEARDENYISTGEGDVLYNVNRPILFQLLATRKPPSLIDSGDLESRLHAIHEGVAPGTARDSEEYRNREIRNRLYRRLLDDPVVYHCDLSGEERHYWENQRTFILREIERATGLIPEIRAEGVAMVDATGDLSDYSLPETGTDGHLTLLVATNLANRLREGETGHVPLAQLEESVRQLALAHPAWRKDTRDDDAEKGLTREVVKRLRALSLIRVARGEQGESVIQPLPAIGRFGLREVEESESVQEELF